MSGVDVRDLANEKLADGKFPVEPRADFRLYIAPEVRRGIEEHAKADVSVEICGVLVGNWGKDENGPYAAVTDYIRCANATSKFAEVTFTHESWAQINKEMDSRFADARIVGWYHSHPDFGIFLSERDAFIQEHFFSGPGQVAYVIDPVRDLEGVFAWRDGKPTPVSHFWIGNMVRSVEASERGAGDGNSGHSRILTSGPGASAETKSPDSSPLGIVTMLLVGLCMLLLGNLYGGWRARAEESHIRQEAVASFVDADLFRLRIESELASVRKRLSAISDSLSKIQPAGNRPTQKEIEQAAIRRDSILQQLKLSEDELSRVEGLADAERATYLRVIALKMSELQRMVEAASAAKQAPVPGKKAPPGAAAAAGDSKRLPTADQPPRPEPPPTQIK